MGDRIDLLIRQAADGSPGLQVFLTGPGQQNAFVLPEPSQLIALQKVWRQRFLKHHDPAFAWAEGAAVVRSYSDQLRQAMQQWIGTPAWQPLQKLLAQFTSLPLTVRLEGVAETISSLPWETLSLQRPVWRLNGDGSEPIDRQPMRARKPRILLLVGAEQGLNLDGEVDRLLLQQRGGRIHLTILRGQSFSPVALRTALAQRTGWDAVLFLGHSDTGAKGGVLHLGDGSQLDGEALAADWAVAAGHGLRLLLLNSCSGLQMASLAAHAGIDWAVCFSEAVPSAAAGFAFGQLLGALEEGSDLVRAVEQTRQLLAAGEGMEGCELLLAVVATNAAQPFRLPLRRRRQLLLRLASTSRRQVIAAAAVSAVALAMELTPANPINSYLLDRRLEVQRLWRQWSGNAGPASDGEDQPIAVLLLDPATTIPALGVPSPVKDHTSRIALAEVLKRIPPTHVPVVGLDVVLDQPRPGTNELAAVLRSQPSRKVVAGYLSPYSDPSQGPIGDSWLQGSILQAAGLQAADLAVGTAAGGGLLKPVPLHLQYPITNSNFAGRLSRIPQPLLPADRVIDWSLDWTRWIRIVSPDELAALRSPLLLVGTTGRLGDRPVDLFAAPATVQGALQRGDRPLWSGNAREVPGVLVQTVLIQSINLGHWLTPLSQTLCTLGAGALGVLVAALLEKRQHKLIAVALIAAVSCPLAYSLAIWQLLLVPLLLPLAAMAATTFSRND